MRERKKKISYTIEIPEQRIARKTKLEILFQYFRLCVSTMWNPHIRLKLLELLEHLTKHLSIWVSTNCLCVSILFTQ